jgi:transcriptional regulator with XRE-family HTH domain
VSRTDRQRYRSALIRQRDERLMASRDPNPARITIALNAAGLYGPEVDRACGVEEPTVDLWESGELVPTREQVEALAELCGVTPVTFYLDDPPAGPIWICSSDGCERVGDPPPAPVPAQSAEVRWLFHPDKLF